MPQPLSMKANKHYVWIDPTARHHDTQNAIPAGDALTSPPYITNSRDELLQTLTKN